MTDTPDGSMIIVDGDVTMDWNLADLGPRDRNTTGWTSERSTRMCWQRGGAALVADLVTASLGDLAGCRVLTSETTSQPVQNNDRRFHHAYALWHRDRDGAWRVDQFLGVDAREISRSDQSAIQNDDSPQLIVLDDAALGFRDASAVWPQAVREPDSQAWFLMKTTNPVATGELWQHLLRTVRDRLIVVLTVDDLRRTEVQISRGLSWERTAQDVVWELMHNPNVNGLGQCAHTVVSFRTAGAILYSANGAPSQLIYDPLLGEDEWEPANCGRMIGNTATLTAAIARQIVMFPTEPDLMTGVHSGIQATRELYKIGYRCESGCGDGLDVGFPLEEISQKIREEPVRLATIEIQDPVRSLTAHHDASTFTRRPGFWTVLEDRYRDGLPLLAERIVLDGLESSLSDVPIGRVGALTTIDRHEIESLSSIESLMREYCRHRQKEPLPIAVFGPPGSGKSFGVEQVAQSVETESVRTLTFNLSQFDDPQALLGALHQVRDIGLSGRLPLVFWDEFDSSLNGQRLGWLRYFLSPMQDGTFQEGPITHPIGRSIFVFAGGTCATMDEFANSIDAPEQQRAVKLPDFVSRLKGFLNVLGPNPQAGAGPVADPYHVIRRAILLRSLLERSAGHLLRDAEGTKQLQIDTGVLRALLLVSRYKHGIRSMKSLLTMSELAGRSAFERSSLPAESQLDLHVDGREFLSLVQGIVLTEELTERLAESAHEIWRKGRKRTGWNFGKRKSESEKTHPWQLPYSKLPEGAKEANRVTVRTMPQKLSLAGYVMVPARSNESAFEFSGEHLERIAEFEHELWMQAKLAAGFQPGVPTPDHPLKNEYLVSWSELAAEIQEADRDLVRGIPQILAEAGYAIVKLNHKSGY